MTVNFSIPAILDENFPFALQEEGFCTNTDHNVNRITTVYGSLPRNILGHARYPGSIPDVSMDFLKDYIQKMDEMNIEFHYTINSPWSGGIERTKNGQRKILDEINKLMTIGVRTFIVSNPFLIYLIKKEMPDVRIVASTNMHLSSIEMIESLLSLGVDSVVLDKKLNRDIGMLSELSKTFGDKLTVLVNSTCLWECPFYDYHTLETGFLSKDGCQSEILEPDFCFNYCMDRFLEEPWSLIKSQWILPEHIDHYKNMGIKNFKIQGRTLKTEDIIKLIRGYYERKTPDGDLFEIWPGFWEALSSRATEQNESINFNRIPVKSIIESDFFNQIASKKHSCSKGCSECRLCRYIYNKSQKVA